MSSAPRSVPDGYSRRRRTMIGLTAGVLSVAIGTLLACTPSTTIAHRHDAAIGGPTAVTSAGSATAHQHPVGASSSATSQHDSTTGPSHTDHPTATTSTGTVPSVSVADLVDPDTGPADVTVRLTAERARIVTSTGRRIDGWTFNGTIPGPQITVHVGELVEVVLVNKDIDDGVTIHWHGLDVPNGMDGVAGITQNAVRPGETFTYRFRPSQVGTFWYHTHQESVVGVAHGLFGTLVVLPATASPGLDRTLLAHTWSSSGKQDQTTIGLDAGLATSTVVTPGTAVRIRLVNSDSLPQRWGVAGVAIRVTAIDGTDVRGPTPLTRPTLVLGAGGRYDLTFTMPDRPVAVGLLDGNRPAQVFSPNAGGATPTVTGGAVFDPLSYGSAMSAPFTMASHYDVEAVQKLETHRRYRNGFVTQWWTINGKLAPDVPMIMVDEGDLVRVHLINASDTVHPMHLHGHHVLVLQRNGVEATGSPWWADTVNLQPGDDAWVAFRADNPGIWMDHCHNLNHAAAGMLMHLAYNGVTSPFHAGHGNVSE